MKSIGDLLPGFSKYKRSALALIAANAVLLGGVYFWGLDVFAVVGVYWIETAIIGVITILKMITACPAETEISFDPYTVRQFRIVHHASKLFVVPFFAMHFGGFCLVLGIIVYGMFGQETNEGFPLVKLPNIYRLTADHHLYWPIVALAASHLFSYFRNYLGRGEYRRTIAGALMLAPYARIVPLCFLMLTVGYIAKQLGSTNVAVLTVLLVCKQVLDLHLHLREHQRAAAKPELRMPKR